MATSGKKSHSIHEIIRQSCLMIKAGAPTQYRLKTRAEKYENEPYRKLTFGARDKNKPHKTILMVGETGTGKTTLINAMINYMLGVQRKDKVWFEITDEQSKQSQAHSQTSIITVYEFYHPDSPIDLTIIDTPGYGDTRGIDLDKEISKSFFSLSKSAEGIHKIHTVCLVVNATQSRLTDRQIYIFDAVQSLFGRDIVDNIVLLFTHSDGATPRNILTAVKEAKVKCAVNERNNQPVFFLFNNRQSEAADEDDRTIQEQSWDLSSKGMEAFFKFVYNVAPKNLRLCQDVLQQREQLEAQISALRSRVETTEQKQKELKQTQDALEQNREYVRNNKNFEYEVEVTYKEKVDIDPAVAKKAMCCTVCEENCHYPDCWWVKDLSWCTVMKNNYCKVCEKKCHFSKHVKEDKIYVTKTKKERRAFDDLRKKYEDRIGSGESVIKKLQEELEELQIEKINLLIEAFDCVETLEKIALNTDSLIILLHIDFLTEKLKEINKPEKAEKLANIKKRAGEKKGALRYITNLFKN